MCGIYGAISERESCLNGLELRHRGPDGEGRIVLERQGGWGKVVLGHRRLAIIDLSDGGRQPMGNEDGSVWLTFNGEIYNYLQLRRDLVARGHTFATRSDTEVIVHGYDEWGESVLDRLHGMFAFALWDQPRQLLFLARDRLGKKPLFYFFDGLRFCFGSEVKTILASGMVQAELDPAGLDHYLTYFYYPPPYTAFRHIRRLAPASALRIQADAGGALALKAWEYWNPLQALRRRSGVPLQEAHERLDHAVEQRLVSDVPLGIFLSGGADSSTITALASRHLAGGAQTFTVAFPGDRELDEQAQAAQISRRFHTQHHVLPVSGSLGALLPQVIRHFDEPFGNPTALLQYELARLTRQHVTVALSGEGGDELFLGYPRYYGAQWAQWYRRLPGFLTAACGAASRFLPEGRGQRRRRMQEFLQFGAQSEAETYLSWVGYFSAADKRALYTPAFRRQLGSSDPGQFLRDRFARGAGLDPLSRLSYVDLGTFLPCNILEYSDRMSMAHSLEVRCPLTDHELVEFALSLPASLKLRRGQSKWIMKAAMAQELPPSLTGARKRGFCPPVSDWLGGELRPAVEELLSPTAVARRGLYQPAEVARLRAEHASGAVDHAMKIWGLMAAEVWHRIYLDGQTEPLGAGVPALAAAS